MSDHLRFFVELLRQGGNVRDLDARGARRRRLHPHHLHLGGDVDSQRGRRELLETRGWQLFHSTMGVLATNTMPGQVFIATPAITGGEIFLRSKERVYCIAHK